MSAATDQIGAIGFNEGVIFAAFQVANGFRGEAIDKTTYTTVFKTPYVYPDPQIAQMAAQRMYAERLSSARARQFAVDRCDGVAA